MSFEIVKKISLSIPVTCITIIENIAAVPKIFCTLYFSVILLTHISLVSILRDMGEQYSPRCDAAELDVPYEAIMFASKVFIEKWHNFKIPTNKSDGKVHPSDMG